MKQSQTGYRFSIQNKIKKEFNAGSGNVLDESAEDLKLEDVSNNNATRGSKFPDKLRDQLLSSNHVLTDTTKYSATSAFDTDNMSVFVSMLNNLNPLSNKTDSPNTGSHSKIFHDTGALAKNERTTASHKEQYWGQMEHASSRGALSNTVQEYKKEPPRQAKPSAPGKSGTDAPKPSAYKCHKCGNAYARLHSLSRHVKFECGVAPKFECFICHKRSKHKHNLLLHMKTHTTHK